MQDEPSFLVLDSSLVLIAMTLLTVYHPGIYFPQMRNARTKKTKRSKGKKDTVEPTGERSGDEKSGDETVVANTAEDSGNEVKMETV